MLLANLLDDRQPCMLLRRSYTTSCRSSPATSKIQIVKALRRVEALRRVKAPRRVKALRREVIIKALGREGPKRRYFICIFQVVVISSRCKRLLSSLTATDVSRLLG